MSRSISSGRPTVFRTPGGNRRATRSPAASSGTVRIGDGGAQLLRSRASAITRGAPATGGRSTGCGARSISTTAPTSTRSAIPQMPGFGVGYVQREGEISEVESGERDGDDCRAMGWSGRRGSSSDPDELQIDVEPVAFGALRLVAPDGRVSLFPRAMCRVHCLRRAFGRGLGRVEPRPGLALQRAHAADDARHAGTHDHRK